MLKALFIPIENFLAPKAAILKRSALAYFIAVGAGSLAVVQFSIDFCERQEERRERRDAAVERAWQSLLTPMGGDTGKGNSLNFLFQSRAFLDGGTLGCENMGIYDKENHKCDVLPQLSGVTFPKILGELPAEPSSIQLAVHLATAVYPNLKDITITDSDLSHGIVNNLFGEGTELSRVRLSDTFIVTGTKATIYDSDLTNSLISEDVTSQINYSNLSGALIVAPFYLRFDNALQWHMRPIDLPGGGNWAWADDPPRHLVGSQWAPSMLWTSKDWLIGGKVTLCDPRLRAEEDTSPEYEYLNEKFTPHFELVRHFEVAPLLDTTLVPPSNQWVQGFEPMTINTHERRYGCFPLSYREAMHLWPEAYGIEQDLDVLTERLRTIFDRRSFMDLVQRANKLLNQDSPPPQPQP